MSSNEPIGAKKPLFVRIYCAVIPATCLILMLAAVAAVVYANRTAGGDVATADCRRRASALRGTWRGWSLAGRTPSMSRAKCL